MEAQSKGPMIMKLTNYGKRFLSMLAIILLLAVLLAGSIICVGDYAYVIHLNQKAYNVIFIIIVMPAATCTVAELFSRIVNQYK